jgi:superfamily II DNA/RNA helicase
VHRIGRTARAGARGTSVTFVDWDDIPRWKMICDELQLPFHEPVETYSTSPHIYFELDIPEGITGSLPRAERTRAGLDAEEIEDLGGRDARRPRGTQQAARPRPNTPRERTERPARNRTRSRTRGGQPMGEAAGAAGDASTPSTESTPASDAAGPARPAGSRRRRRGSRGHGRSGAAAGNGGTPDGGDGGSDAG